MEDILRSIYQEKASNPETLGILGVEKSYFSKPLTDTFDVVLFIILTESNQEIFIKHYKFDDKKAMMYIVTESKLKEWIVLGNNWKAMEWIHNGKVLFDRNEYIKKLKTELNDFPFHSRKIKMAIEFTKLIRRYMDGKSFFQNDQFIDAYNYIVHSLHHLARLSIIENGFHPELMVWNQVKQIEPEIYKLYEELLTSEETIQKRLELLFLASEFLISSKIEECTNHLIEIMRKRDYWSINDLISHPEIKHYAIDLPILLEFLIEKQLVAIKKIETKGKGIFHRYYQINNS
ncbi:hypothetical protein J2S13_003313 [Oikeobacillus pervagus]|uniref:Nucleotidyltransferase-like domain-containing protein n=1 Tax=Oikeobacillus pervagus TaxID=1325931 RepID=A0AAJ1WI17_9BACI|nr:nucleotidyltransferase-like protein [Oikeobacillus pervagus]MDQ0216827.1 hypothetical protein [Oikeobacillus pervagus]